MSPITIGLCGVGAVFVALNWMCLIRSLTTKKFHSLVPPLGGALILVGLLFDSSLRHWAWLGLVVDVGFWAFAFALPDLIAQYRRSSSSRLHLALCGTFDDIEVRLRLFRPDYYEIRLSRLSPLTEPGWQSRGSLGTWTCRGQRTELISHTDTPGSPARAVLTHFPDHDYYEVTESTFTVPAGFAAPEYPPVHFRFDVTSKPNG